MACPLGKTNFPGKHKQAGFTHQAICTLTGRLLAITAPLPRARHDAYAFRAHGLGQFLGSSTLADQGYVGGCFWLLEGILNKPHSMVPPPLALNKKKKPADARFRRLFHFMIGDPVPIFSALNYNRVEADSQ